MSDARPILFVGPQIADEFPAWRDALAALGTPWRLVHPDQLASGEIDPAAITVALVHRMPPHSFDHLPNLAAIASVNAGIENLLADPTIPDVPLLRLADDVQAEAMVEYVLYGVLRLHRGFDCTDAAQRHAQWLPSRETDAIPASARRVTILGLGAIGLPVAHAVAALGFPTAAWSRSPRPPLPTIETRHGPDGLAALLPRSDILVCLLPLTPETAGILNAATFAAMPRGSFILNAGRGGHLVEPDLLPALATGQLAGAVLDVFKTEPLPADHPFWADPRITITPHIAAGSSHTARVVSLVERLNRLFAGEKVEGVIDRMAGY